MAAEIPTDKGFQRWILFILLLGTRSEVRFTDGAQAERFYPMSIGSMAANCSQYPRFVFYYRVALVILVLLPYLRCNGLLFSVLPEKFFIHLNYLECLLFSPSTKGVVDEIAVEVGVDVGTIVPAAVVKRGITFGDIATGKQDGLIANKVPSTTDESTVPISGSESPVKKLKNKVCGK